MSRRVSGQDQLLLICGRLGEDIPILRCTRWTTTYSEPEERIYFGLRRFLCIHSAEMNYTVNLNSSSSDDKLAPEWLFDSSQFTLDY